MSITREFTRRRVTAVVLLVASVLLLWRCTAAFDGTDDVGAVDVFGPWLGDDAEAFTASLEEFTSSTGIEVHYTGTNDFDSDLRDRIAGGLGLPDIAMVPQPSIAAELGPTGLLVPLSDATIDAIVDNYPVTRDDVTSDGAAYLAPYRRNVKSLVWYRPDVFDEKGWEIPETLDDLAELVEVVIDDADMAPWCFSIESGAATGWPATDWIEDLVLRRGGPDAYDEWVAGDRPFTDEVIRNAFVEFDDLVLRSGHSAGGIQRVLSTPVSEASRPLFDDEPGCAMYKQASFATTWFPDGIAVGEPGGVDFFVLPGTDATGPPPLVLGGDSAIQFTDRPDVERLMTYLVLPDGGAEWAERGGYLSGRDSVADDYYRGVDARFARLLGDTSVARDDASDSFFSDVRDSFTAAVAEFVSETRYEGSVDLDTLLDELPEQRPALDDS